MYKIAVLGGRDSIYGFAALGLEVFAERGLVTLAAKEDMMILRPRAGVRADLEQSAYMRALRRTLGQDKRGSTDHGHT